jgi:hypothetical protein
MAVKSLTTLAPGYLMLVLAHRLHSLHRLLGRGRGELLQPEVRPGLQPDGHQKRQQGEDLRLHAHRVECSGGYVEKNYFSHEKHSSLFLPHRR